MKKVLLIGGEGYIGKVVRAKLISSGYHVISYDRLLYQNVKSLSIPANSYTFIEADMIDSEIIKQEIKKCYATVLLAGLVGDPVLKKYPEMNDEININGMLNVIKAANRMQKED